MTGHGPTPTREVARTHLFPTRRAGSVVPGDLSFPCLTDWKFRPNPPGISRTADTERGGHETGTGEMCGDVLEYKKETRLPEPHGGRGTCRTGTTALTDHTPPTP